MNPDNLAMEDPQILLLPNTILRNAPVSSGVSRYRTSHLTSQFARGSLSYRKTNISLSYSSTVQGFLMSSFSPRHRKLIIKLPNINQIAPRTSSI
ncbi:unnamed protein product [Tuber melanosporum]|uniref:(Perigord truffle) hypothetical protein n=1 Tax=Tuber melanosporum (strain Mel28) TaxID=656061 RepID=D5GAR9_TUBMM|nr:uncharacterized protein GSTUM_00003756001 [Tuber melanosporum]CAZ81612.1 unnamed protein product [Tuber melanosporum]